GSIPSLATPPPPRNSAEDLPTIIYIVCIVYILLNIGGLIIQWRMTKQLNGQMGRQGAGCQTPISLMCYYLIINFYSTQCLWIVTVAISRLEGLLFQ
ncbi:MAG: hypothetical protein ACK5RS_03450, partial [Acidobacteriota bacterium]